MARALIVERETLASIAYEMSSAGMIDPVDEIGVMLLDYAWFCSIGRFQRLRGEQRENVGKHQFLMLLLMIDAKFDKAQDISVWRRGSSKQLFQRSIHM